MPADWFFGIVVTLLSVMLVRRRFAPLATGWAANGNRIAVVAVVLFGHLIMLHYGTGVAGGYVVVCAVAALDVRGTFTAARSRALRPGSTLRNAPHGGVLRGTDDAEFTRITALWGAR